MRRTTNQPPPNAWQVNSRHLCLKTTAISIYHVENRKRHPSGMSYETIMTIFLCNFPIAVFILGFWLLFPITQLNNGIVRILVGKASNCIHTPPYPSRLFLDATLGNSSNCYSRRPVCPGEPCARSPSDRTERLAAMHNWTNRARAELAFQTYLASP